MREFKSHTLRYYSINFERRSIIIMLLKEDINRVLNMSDEELDNYLESDEYNNLHEDEKVKLMQNLISDIDLEEKSFDEFAEDVIIQEKLFDRGLKLNENNVRRIRKELKS